MNEHIRAVTKRTQIINAFDSLMKVNRYNKVKVVDIIKKSGVSHQTFYRIFTDKNTLAKEICVEDFSLFFLIKGSSASWKDIVFDALNVIKRKNYFYRRLLSDHIGSDIVKDAIREVSLTYSGAPCSEATLSIWLCVLQNWAKQHFRDTAEMAYKNLLYHLPVCDVLNGKELDNAIERYEKLGLSDYSHFRSWENLNK